MFLPPRISLDVFCQIDPRNMKKDGIENYCLLNDIRWPDRTAGNIQQYRAFATFVTRWQQALRWCSVLNNAILVIVPVRPEFCISATQRVLVIVVFGDLVNDTPRVTDKGLLYKRCKHQWMQDLLNYASTTYLVRLNKTCAFGDYSECFQYK